MTAGARELVADRSRRWDAAGPVAFVSALLRSGAPLLLSGPLAEQRRSAMNPSTNRLHCARWFILMRWIAIVIGGAAIYVAIEIAGVLPRAVAPMLGTLILLLALANASYLVYLRVREANTGFLIVQVYADIGFLIMLLHFAGGIENPLTPLLLLHVILAGIVLGRLHTYVVAAVSSVLFALLSWGECTGALRHYTLTIFPHDHLGGLEVHAAQDSLYAGSLVVLQSVILFLVAWLTTTLVERIHRDERELEALAERALGQARSLERALADQSRAQAQALRAERLAAVGELAGQVAHEVNNPIAIISAKARLLLRSRAEEIPTRVAQEITKIAELSDRVARIAQGLLSYCRPAPGLRAPLDVRTPLRRALAYVEPRAAGLGVTIDDTLDGELPPVRANAPELEQVFLNLFLNALDAMPAGGVLRVSASTTAGILPDAPDMLSLEIADTGMGIRPEIRTRVFEPFMTTKGEKGSGLGLSICQGLVRSHGGEITIESESGCGTRVWVALPAVAQGRGAPLEVAAIDG